MLLRHIPKPVGRRRRLPPVQSPRAVERQLGSQYERLLAELQDIVLGRVLDKLPHLYAEAGIRTDSWISELQNIMDSLQDIADNKIPPSQVQDLARRAANETAIITGRQTQAQLDALTGLNVFAESAMVSDLVDAYVVENTRLIRTLKTELLGDVERLVNSTLRSGVRNESLAKEIRQRFGASKSRARLIARDQTNKLTGQMTRERHKSLGVERYIWRTVNDERVRDRHEALDGKTFSYDNPPASGTNGERLNPGEPIQCRCYAEPLLPDVD